MEFSTLPMDLQMFCFRLNKFLMQLLSLRFARTGILVRTAQAIMDDQPEEIEKRCGEMHSAQTIADEWAKLEAAKDEIAAALAENMNLFDSAAAALKKAGGEEFDLSILHLPTGELAEIKASADAENVYDKFQEYNEALNDFLYKVIDLCHNLSMRLIRI